jgi:beta-lactamase class A
MVASAAMRQLMDRLDAVPGTVSVWCGRAGGPPAYARLEGLTHYAASTMKVAVLAALYRSAEDPDREIPVRNDFASAATGRFSLEQRHDQDDEVWARLGSPAALGWLAERMIKYSSNLATNLVLERVGLDAVAREWQRVGARHSVVQRGIGDTVAAEAGLTNLVTAADLAAILSATTADERMRPILLRQSRTEDLAAGLPAGTRVAHKNGWVMGVRHSAGVIYPEDSPPLALAVCTTTPWAVNRPGDRACQLVSEIARAAWQDRHEVGDASRGG